MRVLLEQREVFLHGLPQIFVDNLRIFPAPFRVQVRVTNDEKCRFLAQIRFVVCLYGGLREARNGQNETHYGNTQQQDLLEFSHDDSPKAYLTTNIRPREHVSLPIVLVIAAECLGR